MTGNIQKVRLCLFFYLIDCFFPLSETIITHISGKSRDMGKFDKLHASVKFLKATP